MEAENSDSITMVDVLEQQAALEEDAHAVLGGSDDKECTYQKGYVKRQALYACLTCCPETRAGLCLACSLSCHENHELVELYTKRNFRCDCGGPSFPNKPCAFGGVRTEPNVDNKYNQNFSGLYCKCSRPYPDPESPDEDEMIQCIVCEDWLHSRHLNARVPPHDRYSEMICEDCVNVKSLLKNYLAYKVPDDGSLDATFEATVNSSGFETTMDTSMLDATVISVTDINDSKIDKTSPVNDEKSTEAPSEDIISKKMDDTQPIIVEKLIQLPSEDNDIKDEKIDESNPTNGEKLTEHPSEDVDINNPKIKESNPTNEEKLAEPLSEDVDVNNPKNDESKLINDEKLPEPLSEVTDINNEKTNSVNDEKIIESPSEDKMEVETEDAAIEADVDKPNLENELSLTNDVPTLESEVSPMETDDVKNIIDDLLAKADDVVETFDEKIPKPDTEVSDLNKDTNSTTLENNEMPMVGTEELNMETNISTEAAPSDDVIMAELSTDDIKDAKDNIPLNDPTPENNDTVVSEENTEAAVETEGIAEKNETKTENEITSEALIDNEIKSEDGVENKSEDLADNNDTKSEALIDNETRVQELAESNDTKADEALVENETKVQEPAENNETKSDVFVENETKAEDKETKSEGESKTEEISENNGTNTEDITENNKTKAEEISEYNGTHTEDIAENNKTKAEEISENNETKPEALVENEIKSEIATKSEALVENKANNGPKSEKLSKDEPQSEELLKNGENTKKRKIDSDNGEADECVIKKSKIEDVCTRPNEESQANHKGAVFWPFDWRTKLCSCPKCTNLYRQQELSFLLDNEDTVDAYENLGKMKTVSSSSQYDKGLEALSSLDRIQQINAITEYNKMKEKLMEFLKTFQDKSEVVREEDIKGFFAGMKPKREPDGVYFCR